MTRENAPLVLGIETSCDDTAGALVDGAGRVLASVVSSQVAHQRYGGVVPEIASREHLRNWPAVSAALWRRSGASPREVDIVAATAGPGLVGALLVGLQLGKGLAYALGRPFFAVNHLEGHLYSPFLHAGAGSAALAVPGRFVGLVVSGGHTSLFDVDREAPRLLAQTRDDALGECFDKIGKRLGLPFPGGPWLDLLAERGAAGAALAIARCGDDSLDFSFSGLKTQALLEIARLGASGVSVEAAATRDGYDAAPPVLDLLAAVRAAAVGQIVERLARHHTREPFARLAVSGGVAANRLLRQELGRLAAERGFALDLVALEYAGDNAAMIAHAALLRWRRGIAADPFSVSAASRAAALRP